ncbi:MAG: methylamine dehydrogenase heavy chain [Gammaproteobacteria bacterium]|jgi:methylamine dehydrogenase heavy chain
MSRIIIGILAILFANIVFADLPNDPNNVVEKLPASYPDTWVYAHDTNFFALADGKVVVVDVAAENRHYKGSLGVGQFGSFLPSSTRSELYAAETFYSKRLRGERSDVITVYDKVNLSPIAEIALPGGKRGQFVTYESTLQFLDNEKYLLLYNFSPAASVSVIDIDKRKIVSEVQIPGCAMIYPTAKLSFASLCSDDVMLISTLDNKGKVKSQKRSKKFFDGGKDPLFAFNAMIGDVAYFPSFLGQVQAIDMSSEIPKILESWSLVTDVEAKENWRPGGWQIITGHKGGDLYVLMHKDGYNGSHKDGGSEVWVFDTKSKKRSRRIVLKEWGVSIEVTSGESPYLVVTNGNYDLDVYSAGDGNWIRMIGGRAFEMPMVLHAGK